MRIALLKVKAVVICSSPPKPIAILGGEPYQHFSYIHDFSPDLLCIICHFSVFCGSIFIKTRDAKFIKSRHMTKYKNQDEITLNSFSSQ